MWATRKRHNNILNPSLKIMLNKDQQRHTWHLQQWLCPVAVHLEELLELWLCKKTAHTHTQKKRYSSYQKQLLLMTCPISAWKNRRCKPLDLCNGEQKYHRLTQVIFTRLQLHAQTCEIGSQVYSNVYYKITIYSWFWRGAFLYLQIPLNTSFN